MRCWTWFAVLCCAGLLWGEEDSAPAVEEVGDGQYKIGLVFLDARTREVRFPAEVNQVRGALEYVLVTEQGKTHESLLRTKVKPMELQVALKLLRYREGKGDLFDRFLAPGEELNRDEEGDSLLLALRWGMDESQVGDWILDRLDRESLGRAAWVWTGSEVRGGRFQAEVEGSIIALYRDALAMLNLKHERAGDDENWFPIEEQMPAVGASVEVILRPMGP